MPFERVVLPIVLSATLAALVACGAAPVKEEPLISVTPDQIGQMSNYADVLALYQNAASALAGKDPSIFAGDFATLDTIGRRLAELRARELSGQFDAARLAGGEVPYSVLKPALDEVSNPPTPAAQWQPVADLVKKETTLTDAAISERSALLEKADLGDENRLVAMDDLYRLTGDQSWLDKRNAFVDRLVEEIRRAKAEGVLNADLQPKIDLVLENRADDAALQQEMVSVSAEIYQTDYFKALGDGLADVAYKVFVKMSASKNFDAIKERLAGVSQKMVEYFIAEADQSVQNPANLSQSYRWYNQARVVSQRLGFKSKAVPGHDVLVEQLHDKYQALSDADAPTLALAYLYAIREFRPLYKGLRQKFSETEEKVRSQAVKRLSTTAFEGGDSAGYGDIISSKVTQYLFTNIPNDIRIVEREKFEALQRERDLGNDAGTLAAVDLIVTGSVLEAKVDTTKQEGKKTVRAVVGKETIPNTAYIKWLELSARDRKDIEKPAETITIDKEENIPINETRHRKVGIFSVSYRLVDAENGRVLFPDSHTEQEEYTGVSQEGVELGDFKLEFKLAELPSDVKILDSLANKVSTEIGMRLVDKLKDQEKRYLADAEEFKQDASCVQYADSLAKALVILEAKDMETTEVFGEYKNVTLNCEGV